MHVRRVEAERSVHCGPSQSRCLVSPRTKLVAGDSAATTMARGEAPRPAARTKRPVLFGSFLGLLLMAALYFGHPHTLQRCRPYLYSQLGNRPKQAVTTQFTRKAVRWVLNSHVR